MNTNTDEILYAFFSKKQAKDFGYCIYLDENGNEVKCTEVNKNNIHISVWDDIVYVGKVVKWISTVKGKINFINHLPTIQTNWAWNKWSE